MLTEQQSLSGLSVHPFATDIRLTSDAAGQARVATLRFAVRADNFAGGGANKTVQLPSSLTQCQTPHEESAVLGGLYAGSGQY